MKDYLQRLEQLDPTGNALPPCQRALVLLTGRSSFTQCFLNPDQERFFDAVASPGVESLRAHFPYHTDWLREPYAEPPLWVASWRSIVQCLTVMHSQRYRRALARHLQVVLDRCQQLLLVTGSAGLALWESARPFLKFDTQVRVLALGPVIWFTPSYERPTIIRGRGDWASRLLSTPLLRPDVEIDGAHLSYYDSPVVHRLVRAWMDE